MADNKEIRPGTWSMESGRPRSTPEPLVSESANRLSLGGFLPPFLLLSNLLLVMGGWASLGIDMGAGHAQEPTATASPEDRLHPFLAPDFMLVDKSRTHLRASNATRDSSMDAKAADIDLDGDLDILLAVEFGFNLIWINDGTGVFSSNSLQLRLGGRHDSEDAGAADFDGDGDIDLLFVSEDDQTNELFFNKSLPGDWGLDFELAKPGLPLEGTSNALAIEDLDGDSNPDVLLGNAGQNFVLMGKGDGTFVDRTSDWLPADTRTTQDLEFGDIDGDGDRDMIVGNEDGSRLLLREEESFVDITDSHMPGLDEPGANGSSLETREADFGDIDGDGDLDLLLANVAFQAGKDPRNRLLVNDGSGHFEDASDRVAGNQNLGGTPWTSHTVDGDFEDIDGDGDLDILLANAFGGGFGLLANDGEGNFEDVSHLVWPATVKGHGIDIEAGDYNGDGRLDLYLARFRFNDGQPSNDLLLFGQDPALLPTRSPTPDPSSTSAAPSSSPRPITPIASVTLLPTYTPTSAQIPGEPEWNLYLPQLRREPG